jgi:hypothetical protein
MSYVRKNRDQGLKGQNDRGTMELESETQWVQLINLSESMAIGFKVLLFT